VGAKNRNTVRAKQQECLDELRTQITLWYIDERLTSLDIQEKLKAIGLDLTVGQVHFAIYRFELKRDRVVGSKRMLVAAQNRKHSIKTCQHCRENYTPHSGNQVYCEVCAPRKPLGTWSRRIKAYGVSKREFDVMFESQQGKCAICPEQLPILDTVIDHDHVTLRVRGLLCRVCNLKLSVIEDKTFVEKAQAYLECNFHSLSGTVKAT